ncbi:MAG: hypothetical protein M1815_003274 [Lichina confinis]|nr:MAG: hypothetical protein M1815_003274 [Lichina confinis]
MKRVLSLGRRKSKSARQQSGLESVPKAPSAPVLLEPEAVDNAPVELLGSMPPTTPAQNTVVDASSPEERRNSAGTPGSLAHGLLSQDFPRLQDLQRQYLSEADGREHATISQLLDSAESRAIVAIEMHVDRVYQLKNRPGNEERIRYAESLVLRYRTIQSNWIRELMSSMELAYRKLRPLASDEYAPALLDGFDVLIAQLDRTSHTAEERATVRILRDRYQSVIDAKGRLSGLDYLWANVVADNVAATQRPSLVANPSNGAPKVVIAPHGDTILELGSQPCFKFWVSSQVLSQVSPFFDYALKPYRQDPIDPRSPPPPTMQHELESTEFVHTGQTLPTTLRLPMDRFLTVAAVSTLLYAAHMRTDKVPRRVSFQEFVDIAYACHKYRCTAPVQIFMECYWLEQWWDRLGGEGYGDLFFISYVFGLKRTFAKSSKAALMRMCEHPTSPQVDSRLPEAVWSCLRHARTTKLRRVLQLSRRTLDLYLLSEEPSSARFRRSVSISDATSPGDLDELQLKRQARCPHGSHECDAANLGWLMLVLNEVGLLPVVLDPTKEEEFFGYQSRSLKNILCKLCAAPSAVGVHGALCDYAPAFREAVCDIYNSVRGLSIWELNDHLTDHRPDVTNSPRAAAAAAAAAADDERDSRGFGLDDIAPAVAPAHGRSRSTGHSITVVNNPGNQLPEQSKRSSVGNTSVETTSDGNTDLTEISRESRGSRLSWQNLQVLEADMRSVASTEVDLRTDRCASPTPTATSVGTLLVSQDAPSAFGDESVGRSSFSSSRERHRREAQKQKASFTDRPPKEIIPPTTKEQVVLRSRMFSAQQGASSDDSLKPAEASAAAAAEQQSMQAEPSQTLSPLAEASPTHRRKASHDEENTALSPTVG